MHVNFFVSCLLRIFTKTPEGLCPLAHGVWPAVSSHPRGSWSLAQFSGPGEEKLKHAAATFCSNQPFALEMIKSRQKKDSRFQTFVQVSLG